MFQTALVPVLYLVASVLFIRGIKGLTRVRTARAGNAQSALGMLLAVVATLLYLGVVDYRWMLLGVALGGAIGAFGAIRVQMTEMPEMVALLNGCGGIASALVALSVVWTDVVEASRPAGTTLADALEGGAPSALTLALGVLIGGITFSGSLVAYAKLAGKMSGQPILLPARHLLNLALAVAGLAIGVWLAFFAADVASIEVLALALTAIALVLGVLLVIPIGGADMPVVISLLNSYSGLAAAMTGFVIGNNMLIIAGALVGSSGLILTRIMCDAMNRSLTNVLFGGFGAQPEAGGGGGGSDEYTNVRSYGAEDAALILESAESVIFVPGYGLAVAQAQHTVKELAAMLERRGTRVAYAIHPVAGRMPGHMNVLLAEADVPYEQLYEMEKINSDFKNTDVVIVVGANDVVNPAAETTPGSPIYGMPVLQVWDATTVVVIKRSLSPGFAGIKNDLFENDNTMMLFADAKAALQELISELKGAAAA